MRIFKAKTKQKYTERAIEHRKSDEINQEKGGCMRRLTYIYKNSYGAIERETKIPQWLFWVASVLHEGLPDGELHAWPETFIKSIPSSKNREWVDKVVKPRFLVAVLESTLDDFDHEKFPDVKRAVDDVIELWRRDDIGSKKWKSAAARIAVPTITTAYAVEAYADVADVARVAAYAIEAFAYSAEASVYAIKAPCKVADYGAKVPAYAVAAAIDHDTGIPRPEKCVYFAKNLIEILNQE